MTDHCERCLELEFELKEKEELLQKEQCFADALIEVIKGLLNTGYPLYASPSAARLAASQAITQHNIARNPQPVEQIAREG